MPYRLPQHRMPEAEVSLRLAFYLLKLPVSQGEAKVAIDGAQVRVHGKQVFPIETFLQAECWQQTRPEGKNPWQGTYEKGGQRLVIHARSGSGDIVARVADKRARAECKGGPLVKKRGSPEYPIIRGVLGQLLTLEQVDQDDVLIAAVPHTAGFQQLVDREIHYSLFQSFPQPEPGIVGLSGKACGLILFIEISSAS